MLKTVAFMRVPNRLVPQYVIAQPMMFDTKKWSDASKFILCKIEENDLPVVMHYNPNIRLKIEKLQSEYPDTTKEVTDDDGTTREAVEYGYFSVLGNSDLAIEKQPQLTVDDVEVF